MTICRTCGRASPSGATYCESCGRSFGSRICPAKHQSSPEAQFCQVCGSEELSTATKATRFGFLARLSMVLVALVLLKMLSPLFPGFIWGAFCFVAWIFNTVFGHLFSRFFQHLTGWAIVWMMLWLCVRLTFGPESAQLAAYERFSSRLVKLLYVVSKWALKSLFKLGRRPRESR